MTMSGEATVLLFSYGTLQLREVQLATFGRELDGAPDALPGYVMSQIAIADADVVGTSGVAHHPIVRRTGDPADRVPGVVFALTDAELAEADAYETDDYARLLLRLASGTEAFVYVAAAD
jgi:gamma-glutamyl AIG2-like cyclotransferase